MLVALRDRASRSIHTFAADRPLGSARDCLRPPLPPTALFLIRAGLSRAGARYERGGRRGTFPARTKIDDLTGAGAGHLVRLRELLLFTVAAYGDRRARQGRPVIDQRNHLRAVLGGVLHRLDLLRQRRTGGEALGVWFLPIYLGPTLAMLLAWIVLRKIVRIARTYRITSIADFIASRYGKSPLLAALVTLITVVGIVPYIALQLKAVSGRLKVLTGESGLGSASAPGGRTARSTSRWRSPPSPSCSARATSTSPSGTRAWSRRSPSSPRSSSSPSSRSAPS